MAEQRVVVEVDLGVEREQPPVGRRDKRIDLEQRSVRIEERLVEAGQKLHRGIDLLRAQPQLERDLARLKRLEAHARIDVLLQNRIRIFRRDLLNLHPARRRRHEHRLALGAVHQNSQVEFLLDGQRLFDQQPPHDATFRPGLVRHQLHAQHFGREIAGLVHRLGDLHAAALAAAAGMNLRLHHHSRSSPR